MAIQIGFSTNEGSGPILSAGQHPCVLKSVKVVNQKKYQSEEYEDRLQFTFERLQPERGQDAPGVVSVWTGLNYGPKNAKLTEVLDQIFGRSLTTAEVGKMDIEAMAGKVRGYVLVVPHTKQDGSRTTKFGSFIHAPNVPVPTPEQFPVSPNSAASGPALPPDWQEGEEEDLGDPFATQDADGLSTAQQGHVRRAA